MSALILALAFVVYCPAITNGFIWDDDVMLTENQVMKADDGLQRIWFSTELPDYFPLTSTSFWLEWRLWGMNPIGYNITNILLHALSAILLWQVLLELKIPGAWLASILFAVHPICVASVDWIAERKNTLSLLFYLLALLLYLRFEVNGRKRLYVFSIIAFLLALLSKTSVVVLPVVLLLFCWWRRKKLCWQDFRRAIPFFALAFAFGAVTVWFQLHEVFAGEALETGTFLTRILGGSRALWFYAGKILLPASLSMIYPQWQIAPEKVISYLPGLMWFAMLLVFWRFRKNWGGPFFFAFAYFTIALLPVLGFFDMNFLLFSQVGDHLQYIAMPGVIALAVGLGVTVWTSERHNKYSGKLAAMIPIATLALLTWRQSSTYADEETLWRDTIRKNPTAWIGYHNLADRIAELGRYEEAAFYYQEALRLKPDYAKTHNNLGNCFHLLGFVDQAIHEFTDAIQGKPELAEAHGNLGAVYYRCGQYAKALASYQRAIELKPQYGVAYFGAGNAALQLGDSTGALDYYFSAGRFDFDSADLQYNIALILSLQKDTNSAIRFLRRALQLQPQHALAAKELKLLMADTEELP